MLFSAIFLLPGDSYALVSYGTQITYQTNDTTADDNTTTTVQERFRLFLDMNSKPTSNLTLISNLSFDVLGNQASAGSDSLQLQPSLSLRLSAPAVKLGMGYRQILRDDTIIAGNTTSSISDESSDLYADTNITLAKLPYIRMRFSQREQKRDDDGVVTTDTSTDDLQAGVNYNVNIMAINANYGLQRITNRLAMTERELSQINGNVNISKSLGSWAIALLRGTFSLNKSLTDGTTDSERSTTTGEARLNATPFDRTVVNTSYLYRETEDVTSDVGASTDKSWVTNASYAFPRFVRLYGTYSNRVNDSTDSQTTTDIEIIGISFNHNIEKLNIAAKYEKRLQTNTTVNGGQTESTLDRDMLDWTLSLRPADAIFLTLSESLVINTSDDMTTETNRFRLKMIFGPVYNFTSSPFVDYTIITDPDSLETKTTQFIVPLDFRINLVDRVQLQFNDNYTWRTEEREGLSSSVQTNSAVMRLNWASPVTDLNIAADASFASSSTDTTSTSTSSYTLRLNWRNPPHRVNTNIRYQTGSDRVDSAGFSAQYGLDLRLKKLQLSFQANYSYNITFSSPSSTGSSIFLALRLRK